MNMVILTKLGDNGRFVIPSEIRKQLKLKEGDQLKVGIEDGKIVILTPDVLLNAFYDLTETVRASGDDVVGELIDERRREAEAE